MRVKEVVIDGFKSYAKRTVITNWDPQFNCITGLNGSGKSNILDAICFVLGITTMSTVRAQSQQDLIYKRGQAGVTKASVSIVFDNSDKSRSPLDYRGVDTITVTRQVVLGGTSKYLVNGHRAQQAQVQQLFQEVQLNVNNPNFLIMQGQITKVVNMRPTEILGLIEEAAGTGMYEKERLKAIKEIRDRDGPLHETEALLNEEVRPKLEKLRSQKRQFLEYQQCAASAEALERVLAVSEYKYHKQKLTQLEEDAQQSTMRTDELKSQLDTETSRSSELESRLSELQSQQKTQEAVRLDAELQSASEEHARTVTELEHKQQQLKYAEDQYNTNTDAIAQFKKQLNEYEENVGTFESDHAKLKAEYEQQRAVVEERRELLSGLQTGISTTGDKETGFAYTTKRARENLADSKQQINSLQAEKERLQASLAKVKKADTEAKLADAKARLAEIQESERDKQVQLDRLADDAQLARDLKKQHQELKDSATHVDRELERIMARYPNLDIPGNSNQVKGRVAHIFKVPKEHLNKSLALEVCAGAGIWSLVVDNEKVGATILKTARKRMTVLPLNRMRSQVINRDTVRQIDSKGAWLALDLLGFDEEVRPAIEYIFGRTVICATSSIAERAAFKFGVRSVTFEGDVFDPRGVISGGFQGVRGQNNQRASGASSIFNAVSQYQSLLDERLETQTKIADIESQLESVGHSALAVEQLQNELTLVHHEAQLTQNRLVDVDSEHKRIVELEGKLHEIDSEKLNAAHEAVGAAQRTLDRALKDAAEFNANREGKLKEIGDELEKAVARESKLSEELELRATEHSKNQSELARLRADLSQEEKEREGYQNTISELQADVTTVTSKVLPEIVARISSLEKSLAEENSRLTKTRTEMQDIETELLELHAKVADMRLSLQKASHLREKQGELLAAAQASLNQVLKRWQWVPQAVADGSVATTSEQGSGAMEDDDPILDSKRLEQLRQNFAQEQRRLQSLASRVDSSVVTMIERLETDENQLRQRLDTIREDRRKLEESMETLNDRRRRTIDKVWKQVSKDFGLIFGDLLPNSSCELVPLSDQPIKNGFLIRVRLGETWKDGLTELSGGQRSLVALALILALLRYHPAPVYILDEVDAALDVHHTRNIGHIIKTRFQNAQFIVVSLKDDMFTNANRIFQTRFIDGTSTVAIMV